MPTPITEAYTCLMSVYGKEDPRFLEVSIDSILNQSVLPSEFIIVQDGPLGAELENTLARKSQENPNLFKFVKIENNVGLWKALSVGIQECSNELIMRMDSDDYSRQDRAEIQLSYMANHPECCCCGSLVVEFLGYINNPVSQVVLPEQHDDIVRYSKTRNPLRHPTMMYRKSVVLSVGSYQEMPFFEDYDLVMRLIRSGHKLHNIQDSLVYMRTSEGFYARRGDRDYLGYMHAFRKKCLKDGYINAFQYCKGLIPHAIVCIAPNSIRELIYKRLLRNKVSR